MKPDYIPSTEDASSIRFTLHLISNDFLNLAGKHCPESPLKTIKRNRETRLPCPSILEMLRGFLCYAFSDVFNSHLIILSVLRHLYTYVAREPYAEAYPGCKGMSEEIKLQSISLELISITYRVGGGGRERGEKCLLLN